MARYPDAEWRPLGGRSEPRLTKKNKVIIHTMVGSLNGTDSFFRNSGYSGVESHFGVGGSGTVYQWQDTDLQADAQLQGNDDAISIETADHGPRFPSWSGSNVPAWTDDQVEAIAQIVAWTCELYDIPCRLIPDTRESTRGVGYHRQGIEPWRKHGELYSNSFGKVCPGDRRVNQIPRVIDRANAILNGEDLSYNQVWRTDDRMNAPELWTDLTKNRHWWAETMMERMADAISELRDGHFDKPNEADKKWKPVTFWRWGYAHAANASSKASEAIDLERANGAKLDALLDAHAGSDADSIKAHIDQRYTEAATERAQLVAANTALMVAVDELKDAMQAQGAELTTLLAQYADGLIAAEDVADALLAKLHEVTAPDAEGN